MKNSYFWNILYLLLLSGVMSSCIEQIDLSKSNKNESPKTKNNQPIDDTKNNQLIDNTKNNQPIDKIRIDSHVLSAMKEQIASQAPIRGGFLFGTIVGSELKIQYFFYDFTAIPSSSSYVAGRNANEFINYALGYGHENNYQPLNTYVGHSHSMPGTMGATSDHEQNLDQFFAQSPKQRVYVMPIVTMGSKTVRNIESHEMKLGDNAKVSFFLKERGQPMRKMTRIEKFDTPDNDYYKMNSRINSDVHIFDAFSQLNLRGLGEIKMLRTEDIPSLKDWESIYSWKITGKRKIIQFNFPLNYPNASPELICHEQDANSDRTRSTAKRMLSWQSNEKNPKNFEQFLNDFITTTCPIK